jgi:hypothetical protein
MKQLVQRVVFAVGLMALVGFLADAFAANEVGEAEGPEIEDLGDDRYRIGEITVDKAAHKFTLRGKILHLEKPLEYLAVKKGGYKGYESLLELETSAVEFQLACILIGLDDADSVKPEFQFDDRKLDGQLVDIDISWDVEGQTKTTSAGDALASRGPSFEDSEWVYIGSQMSPQDGSLLAETSGTLIGFVHDPLSIIEHRTGATAGAYGMVTGNAEILPPAGSPVSVTISVIGE